MYVCMGHVVVLVAGLGEYFLCAIRSGSLVELIRFFMHIN